jgi:hypothetical protein
MFRSMSGYKAQYHDLTMLVISEFNSWRVLIYAPGTTIHGAQQFGEDKAKEHALTVARTYLHDVKHDDMPDPDQAEWVPSSDNDWLVWRS